MAILIDTAIWPWRDWLWCHMVSDTSVAELKEFALELGIPERGFQGDHFDIPEHMREIAISAGAIEVSSREILRALYAAGIRQTPSQRHGRPKAVPPHQP
jgi:hypothetical protein